MMTGVGVLLGTAAYMTPEQAKGREADKRSDMWAFGCVLYEMLTGRRAFDGEDMTDVLGAVVRLEPNWEALPSDVPQPVRALLHGCLVKDRRQRIADIAVARFVLDHQRRHRGHQRHVGSSAASTVQLWPRIATLTAGALAVAAPRRRAGLVRNTPGAAVGHPHDGHDVRVGCVGAPGRRSRRRHHARRLTRRLSRQQPVAGPCARPTRAHGADRSWSCAARRIRLARRTMGRICRRNRDEESRDHGWTASDIVRRSKAHPAAPRGARTGPSSSRQPHQQPACCVCRLLEASPRCSRSRTASAGKTITFGPSSCLEARRYCSRSLRRPVTSGTRRLRCWICRPARRRY